ncbi:hypothetical protein [Streptomyces sp. TN58]|uniref:hypothetical protein n=1 Tax=Streptomyces sp. TN58 TaxID=234612 RepID=UPI000950728C|nr:hypothetical protein [Streptomyces sp. TN58]APU41483.1 hypothetical protein BSL84_18730 [Streptomyces sp. TN58]
MSRPRPFGRAVLAVLVAVLAVLLGGTAPAAAGTVLPDAAPAGTTGRAPLRAEPDAPGAVPGRSEAPRAVPGSPDAPRVGPLARGGGPSCAPAAPDHGGTPAVPARAGGDHAQVPPGRPVPPVARPHAGLPVRAPVRGPDRPAPGPVELSVMRV